MKKLFYLGTFLGFLAIVSVIASAQVIIKPSTTLTKADLIYSATSTQAQILTENELIQVKAEYNNTDRIVQKLEVIQNTLLRIEKLSK